MASPNCLRPPLLDRWGRRGGGGGGTGGGTGVTDGGVDGVPGGGTGGGTGRSVSGCTHADRSKNRNSSAFSWADRVTDVHPVGNGVPSVPGSDLSLLLARRHRRRP